MYSTTYYVQRLTDAGIATPGVEKARELNARELLPADQSGRAADDLAQHLADGTLTAAEVAERLAPLVARSSPMFGQIVQQAQNIRQAQARQALAADAPAIDKRLRELEKAARDAESAGTKTLGKAGAFTADEAVELGPEAAAAWATRASARRTLAELAQLRAELVRGNILPEPESKSLVERAKTLAGIG